MHSVTGAGPGRPAADPAGGGLADPALGHAARARLLAGLAAAGIGGAILIMIAASAVRDSWMDPPIVLPAWGPPWDLQSAHVPVGVVTVALWVAVLAGLGGVLAGLAAVRLGARPGVRDLLVAAALAVAALTVLLPAGSTDALDYAAYGRILALGHNPYVMTPYQLRLAHNAFARSVPTPGSMSERLRAARDGAAVPGGQARRHVRGADRVRPEAGELARLRPRRVHRRPAAAPRPGPAAARPSAGPSTRCCSGSSLRPGTSTCSPPRPACSGCSPSATRARRRGPPARLCAPGGGGRADRGRQPDIKANYVGVRPGRGLGPAPLARRAGDRRPRRARRARARLRVVRDARGPCPGRPPRRPQRGQFLPRPPHPLAAAAPGADRSRRGGRRGGADAPAAARSPSRAPSDPGRPGAERRVAVLGPTSFPGTTR